MPSYDSDGIPYNHPSVEEIEREVGRSERSIAQALTECDALTDFTLKFFDNYVKLQKGGR